MQKLVVELKDKNYDIMIGKNIFSNIISMIKNDFNHNKYLIVTDENVSEIYLEKLEEHLNKNNINYVIYTIVPGENSKSITELENIYNILAENKFTRRDAIIGFGGGVVGDLSGFGAATYLRGIDFIQIPTSLLAQVDSSVGGKVAINIKQGKNLVGNFYQPKAVYIDVEFLKTLPEREFKSGLAEVIKYGCIYDKAFFDQLNNYENLEELKKDLIDIVKKSLETKVYYVQKDEKEEDVRMFLNFGHTIGHGVEKYFNYKYNHGEGVSIGMNYILKGAFNLGLIKEEVGVEVLNILNKFEMEVDCEIEDLEKIIDYIQNDKKSKGDYIDIILIKDIGDSFIHKLTIEELEKMMEGI